MLRILILAALFLSVERNGISLTVEGEPTVIDPARSVFLTVTVKSPHDIKAVAPDIRDRVRGFSLAEDFAEEPFVEKDGRTVQVVNWKLVPKPYAEEYKIAPFVVAASPRLLSSRADDGKFSFYAGPIRFEPPLPREHVTGDMEANPTKDVQLSWNLVGEVFGALVGILAILAALFFGVRYVFRRIKEHRMSPIERAWVELDRLLKKGLPGRGRYKDFYVELTMVVRRYVQRKYGIRAPHLTTEEFLRECGASEGRVGDTGALRRFLESSDMVKFAGVEATPEMADEATDSARNYLKGDSQEAAQ
jgi:hypothetical protein